MNLPALAGTIPPSALASCVALPPPSLESSPQRGEGWGEGAGFIFIQSSPQPSTPKVGTEAPILGEEIVWSLFLYRRLSLDVFHQDHGIGIFLFQLFYLYRQII